MSSIMISCSRLISCAASVVKGLEFRRPRVELQSHNSDLAMAAPVAKLEGVSLERKRQSYQRSVTFVATMPGTWHSRTGWHSVSIL